MADLYDTQYIIKKLGITEDELQKEIILKQQDDLFFLIQNQKQNVFNAKILKEINSALDTIEQAEHATALISLSLNKKTFNSGMDLKFLLTLETAREPIHFTRELIYLYGRLLQFPVPCVAMINGYAIAGGMMYAFAHDYRIARDDFGFLQMSELLIGMHIPPGMNAVIQNKIWNPILYKKIVLEGYKVNMREAFENNLVDDIVSVGELFEKTVQFAKSENKTVYKQIKQEMNKDAINKCFNSNIAPGVAGEWPLPKW